MDARLGQVFNGATTAIALERAFAAPNYAPIPVVLERGDGCWLWDADGKRYLDFMSAYSAVSHGHAHPRLVRALIEQAQRMAVTSRAYHSTLLGPFLAKLVEVADLPAPARALPASGGCESVETAIKAARRWGYRVKGILPDRAEIVVARGNFHGRSSTSGRLFDRSVVPRGLRTLCAGLPSFRFRRRRVARVGDHRHHLRRADRTDPGRSRHRAAA